MMHAIELRDVRKTFGANVAVDDLSLAVPRGAVYGVIGPSGAGKTTCIRMIMSILFPDSGSVSVLGPRLGARGQGPHRLPAGRARRLPQDARRRVPHLPGAAQGREPRGGRGARAGPARAGRAARHRAHGVRRAVEGHAAAGAVRRRHPARARTAHPRRAVQRPRSRSACACCASRCGARTRAARRFCSRRTSWRTPRRCASTCS